MFTKRQLYVYLGLSFLIIVLAHYGKLVMIYWDYAYSYLHFYLIQIFQHIGLTSAASQLLLLITLPLLIVGLPALIYYLIKKKSMPYFAEMIWILWLIILFSNILMPYNG